MQELFRIDVFAAGLELLLNGNATVGVYSSKRTPKVIPCRLCSFHAPVSSIQHRRIRVLINHSLKIYHNACMLFTFFPIFIFVGQRLDR